MGSQFKVRPILVGKSRQKGLEAAGHTISTVKIEMVTMLPSSLSPVYTVQDPSQGTGLSTKKASPRASADTIKTIPTDMFISQVTPDPVELTQP